MVHKLYSLIWIWKKWGTSISFLQFSANFLWIVSICFDNTLNFQILIWNCNLSQTKKLGQVLSIFATSHVYLRVQPSRKWKMHVWYFQSKETLILCLKPRERIHWKFAVFYHLQQNIEFLKFAYMLFLFVIFG